MSTANKSSNRWLALMSATLAFTFTFLSRFTWAPLMSTVMEEFSINATQAGLYMSPSSRATASRRFPAASWPISCSPSTF